MVKPDRVTAISLQIDYVEDLLRAASNPAYTDLLRDVLRELEKVKAHLIYLSRHWSDTDAGE